MTTSDDRFADVGGEAYVINDHYRSAKKKLRARPAAVNRRSVADKQLNLNGRNPFSRRSSVPRAQRDNVVAECSDHVSNPVQGTILFSFLLFAINKAYF